MSAFWTLLKLQLYLRLSALKPANWLPKRSASAKEWRPLLMGFLFLFVIASILVWVLVIANAILRGLVQIGTPELLLSMVILLCMLLTLLVGFFHVTSVLFFSKDSAFLAGLPASSRAVMTARLSLVLLGEIALTALIFLPVCILYGVRTGQGALFYLRAVVLTPFIPCLPLTLAALLSFLLIRVSSLFRHRDRFAVIGGFLLIALVIPLQMRFYSFIPQNAGSDFLMKILSDNQAMLEEFLGGLPPVLWATAGVAVQGEWGLLSLALFLAVSAASAALPVLIAGRYLQLAIQQSEVFQGTRRRKLRDGDLVRRRSPVMALFVREWREVLRVPSYALNGLVGIVMLPIMMVALFLGTNGSSELSALLSELLRQAGGVKITLFGAAAMAAVCTVNMAGATAVSREGRLISFSRMIPVPYAAQLMAKQLFGFSINFLTCLTTAITLAALMPSEAGHILAAFTLGLLFGFSSNALSLALDASHPKLNWRNETEAIKQNAMALLSMVLGVAAGGVLGLGAWGLFTVGVSLTVIPWLLTIVLLASVLAAYTLLVRKAKGWYSRIEL